MLVQHRLHFEPLWYRDPLFLKRHHNEPSWMVTLIWPSQNWLASNLVTLVARASSECLVEYSGRRRYYWSRSWMSRWVLTSLVAGNLKKSVGQRGVTRGGGEGGLRIVGEGGVGVDGATATAGEGAGGPWRVAIFGGKRQKGHWKVCPGRGGMIPKKQRMQQRSHRSERRCHRCRSSGIPRMSQRALKMRSTKKVEGIAPGISSVNFIGVPSGPGVGLFRVELKVLIPTWWVTLNQALNSFFGALRPIFLSYLSSLVVTPSCWLLPYFYIAIS